MKTLVFDAEDVAIARLDALVRRLPAPPRTRTRAVQLGLSLLERMLKAAADGAEVTIVESDGTTTLVVIR